MNERLNEEGGDFILSASIAGDNEMEQNSLPAGMQPLWARLWALSPEALDDARYTTAIALEVSPNLDSEKLCEALAHVIRVHEVLRLRFSSVSSSPTVELVGKVSPRFELEDLRHVSIESQRRLLVDEYLREAERDRFPLSSAPLWRVRLLRIDERRDVLILSFFHLLFDGWSLSILLEDLFEAYVSLENGALPHSREEIAYLAAVEYERSALNRRRDAPAWLGDLTRSKECIFPLRLPEPDDPVLAGGSWTLDFSGELACSLREGAWKFRTTPFVLIVAAYGLALMRSAERYSVTISTTVTGRTGTLLRRVLGQFTRDLYFPVGYSRSRELPEYVDEVSSRILAAKNYSTTFDSLFQMTSSLGNVRGELADLGLFDAYIQSVSERNASFRYGDLCITQLVEPKSGCSVTGPRVSDIRESLIPVWTAHVAPYAEVSSGRDSLTLYFNSTFYEQEGIWRLRDEIRQALKDVAYAAAV
jgi:hypothetical protein